MVYLVLQDSQLCQKCEFCLQKHCFLKLSVSSVVTGSLANNPGLCDLKESCFVKNRPLKTTEDLPDMDYMVWLM